MSGTCPPVNVGQALMQLQATCAFVGLQMNVAKTKCMGVSGEQVAVVQRAEAQHECMIVQWDDGR